MPSGRALEDPSAAAPEDLTADRREPRSLYAPVYAPVLLPMATEVAVFPRRDRAFLVADAHLPEDTTFHAGHAHPRPWMEAGDQADVPDRVGLFALPVEGSERPFEARVTGEAEAVVLLEVPLGAYVVSVESWSPERRRAGRLRVGLRVEAPAEDVAALSDLLLLRPTAPPPTALEEALPLVRIGSALAPGEGLALAWELTGLGFRTETLEYAVSVERTDRTVLRRIGEFLGLAERPRPLALAWQEPGPDSPTHQFRYLDLELPPLDPGGYEITLTLRTQGRADVVARRAFRVVEPA
jgi:hypothetical protein